MKVRRSLARAAKKTGPQSSISALPSVSVKALCHHPLLDSRTDLVMDSNKAEDAVTSTPIEPLAHTNSDVSPLASKALIQYWLIKAEPATRIEKGIDVKFGIDDLERVGSSGWDGVRNYEARNIMRDKMRHGDLSPGIAGIASVSAESLVDDSAFDKSHPYYDPKSDPTNPRWFMVRVSFVRKLARFIPLKELQGYKDGHLSKMVLIHRGRLSVQPVSPEEFRFILELEKQAPPDPASQIKAEP
ncbi:hypothetical protein BSLG_009140 [Batrachochytrium salamandrivorans]|nr:hypothetical protein BSLG_009140 [Batrachochytrium salamandrivorans]